MKRLLYVVLLVAGAVAIPFAPASAAGACVGESGVTVVVQFKDEPVQVGCAVGNPSSGYQALRNAGFSITNVPSQPQAVCTINGQPDLDQETCWGKTNYWSYWHGKPGHSWSYATTSAGFDPAPGSYEGWHFGDGTSPPRYQLPTAVVTSTPTPTHKPTARPTSGATKGTTNPAAQSPTASHPSTGTSSRPPDATSSPGAITTGTPTGNPTAPASDDLSTAPDPTVKAGGAPSAHSSGVQGGSGNHSWIWGILLVGVLGCAAAFTAARRRRS